MEQTGQETLNSERGRGISEVTQQVIDGAKVFMGSVGTAAKGPQLGGG